MQTETSRAKRMLNMKQISTTHILCFQCRDFQTPVQSVQTGPVSYSLRPSATWSPRY